MIKMVNNNGDRPINGGNWPFLRDMNDHQTNNGLTKREHFAAMAMQGLCGCSISGRHKLSENLAREAVMYGDALLAELAKEAVQ